MGLRLAGRSLVYKHGKTKEDFKVTVIKRYLVVCRLQFKILKGNNAHLAPEVQISMQLEVYFNALGR